MFQKHPMSFGRASAVCSRCISSKKGTSRHRMFGRHPMSNQNEFRLGKRNRFWDYNISCGLIIIRPLFLPVQSFALCFVGASGPLAPTIFPDIGCFKNIRCLLAGQALFVPDAFHRTRGFPDIGCLADIRFLTKMNSVWGKESVLGLWYFVRGQMIIRSYN